MPIFFMMQGKCLFPDISRSDFVYVSSEDFGETVRICRLVRDFANRKFDKYQNITCWLIYFSTKTYVVSTQKINLNDRGGSFEHP